MARHIQKDDLAIVTAGAHKGKTGKVTAVLPKKEAVIIEGVNIHVKNKKPTPLQPKGSQERREFPIRWSNVSPAVKVDGKLVATRVRFQEAADGTKVRVAVKGGETLGRPIRKASKAAAK